jgi:hypothetical protein
MPPPEKVVKEFLREGDLQLFRLEKLHEFQLVRCDRGHDLENPLHQPSTRPDAVGSRGRPAPRLR